MNEDLLLKWPTVDSPLQRQITKRNVVKGIWNVILAWRNEELLLPWPIVGLPRRQPIMIGNAVKETAIAVIDSRDVGMMTGMEAEGSLGEIMRDRRPCRIRDLPRLWIRIRIMSLRK
jgi:hypothetical protein